MYMNKTTATAAQAIHSKIMLCNRNDNYRKKQANYKNATCSLEQWINEFAAKVHGKIGASSD